MSLSYADAGVNRQERDTAKKAFSSFEGSYGLSKYGKPLKLPFNTVYPVGEKYNVKTCDGVGTKVLIAELAGKHDTIGIDAVAMVVNDAIRCGAEPIAVTDIIDARKSTPELLGELQKGLEAGVEMAGCPLVGGETADVPELMSAPYHINCDCVGEVDRKSIVSGRGISAGDVVVGMRSSGLHSNGISLARKALFKEWGGSYGAFDQPDGIGGELAMEALKPTEIYVKPALRAMAEYNVKAAVHITGDAYLKFGKLFGYSPGIGFEFDNFHPQGIFKLIQRQGVSWEEMFKTFNMGWGFALVVAKEDADGIIQLLGGGAEVIGHAIKGSGITISYEGKKMGLSF